MGDAWGVHGVGLQPAARFHPRPLAYCLRPLPTLPRTLLPSPLPACLCHQVIARGGNSPDSLVLPGVIPNRLVLEPAHWEEQLYKRASAQTGLKAGGQGGMPTRLRVFSGTANPVRGARGGQADMPALLFRHRQPGE